MSRSAEPSFDKSKWSLRSVWKRLPLIVQFAVASLVTITVIAVGGGKLLTGSIARLMLEREAQVSMEFVLNVLRADGSLEFLGNPEDPELKRRFAGSIIHFTSIKELERINIYARDRKVLWSTDGELIGTYLGANDELEEALRGELVVESGQVNNQAADKFEHSTLPLGIDYFVETYIPVRAERGGAVLGVVEMYKAPYLLTAAINSAQRQIWAGALIGAVLLFVTVFGIVRSADRRMRGQQSRIVQAETMAVVGEFASAIAHNIRNPLSSIRSSAEVAREYATHGLQDLDGIMERADRIDRWLQDLVNFANVDAAQSTRVDAVPLMREQVRAMAKDFASWDLRIEFRSMVKEAQVSGDANLLGQVLTILLVNAAQASGRSGRVLADISQENDRVIMRVADSGPGIAPENFDKLFTLFFTTKSSGMGVGLALTRRAIEHFGGSIRAERGRERGAMFVVELPAA